MFIPFKEEFNNSVFNPYSTTVGRLKYKDMQNVVKQIKDFMLKQEYNKEALSYGMKIERFTPIILIGKEEGEDYIPLFDFPLIVSDSFNNDYLVIDLRQYVSKDKLKTTDVQHIDSFGEVMSRLDNPKILLRMAAIMGKLANGEFGSLGSIYGVLGQHYISYLASVYDNVIKLDPRSLVEFRCLAALFFFMLTNPGEVQDHNHGDIQLILKNKFGIEDWFLKEQNSFETMYCDYAVIMQNIVPEDKHCLYVLEKLTKAILQPLYAEKFNVGVINSSISNHWSFAGKNLTMPIALENVCLFAALLEACMINNSFKNSRFYQFVFKGRLKTNNYDKNIADTFRYTL